MYLRATWSKFRIYATASSELRSDTWDSRWVGFLSYSFSEVRTTNLVSMKWRFILPQPNYNWWIKWQSKQTQIALEIVANLGRWRFRMCELWSLFRSVKKWFAHTSFNHKCSINGSGKLKLLNPRHKERMLISSNKLHGLRTDWVHPHDYLTLWIHIFSNSDK